MARRALVEIVGDSASLQRSLEQAAAAAASFDGELKKLAVDAQASMEAQVRASATKVARLQEEAAAAKALGASYAVGSREQVAAGQLEQTRLERLARLQGTVGLSADEAAGLQVRATLRQVDALNAEVAAYGRLAAAAGASAREQQAASRFAAEAQTRQAALLGIPAAAAAGTFGRQVTAAERVGRTVTTGVTLPAAFVGYEAVKQAVEFNRQMLLIQTQAGASAGEVKRLSGAVLDLAKVAPQGPAQLAEGLYHLESIGLRGGAAMRTLQTSSIAAGQGIANLEDVTTALGGVVVTDIQGAENYQRAMDTLTATVGAGNLRFEDLAGSIGNVTPAAAAAGVTLPELGAAIATLTDRGFSAEEASTRLRMSLALIQSPSEKARKALKDMGVDADSLGGILRSPNGLLKVLELLHAGIERVGKTRGNKDLLAGFGGGRSGLGIQTLVGSLDSPLSSYQQKLADVSANEKKASENRQAYLQSDSYKLHAALSTVEADMVKLGDSLTPVVTVAAKGISALVDAFTELPGPIKDVLGGATLLFAVGGPLLYGGAKVVKILGEIRLAFGLLPGSAAAAEAGTGAAFAGIEGQAAAASTEVSALRAGLLGLGAIGLVTVGIDIIEHLRKDKGARQVGGAHSNLYQDRNTGHYYLHPLGARAAPDIAAAERHGYRPPQSVRAAIRQDRLKRLGLVGDVANSPDNRGGIRGPGSDPIDVGNTTRHGPRPITKFTLPFRLQLEAAKAGATPGRGDDLKADRDIRASVERTIASGRLKGQALLDAYQELGTVNTDLAAQVKKAAKTAQTYATPLRLQLEAARAATTTSTTDDRAAALRIKQAAEKALASGKLGVQAQIAAYNTIATANAQLTRQAGAFVVPLPLQVQEARAQALAALSPNQQGPTGLELRLARELKRKALAAIKSHHLSLQGLIDAWNEVGQANQTLAQQAKSKGLIDTYHAVSTEALTAGLDLARDQRKQLEERLAQRAAHRGQAPNGPAAQGQVIHLHNPQFHGVHDVRKLNAELDKLARSTSQRRGTRR